MIEATDAGAVLEHTRRSFDEGTITFVPADFSAVPAIMRAQPGPKLVIAACSMPDARGFVSLGVGADYTAALVGELPLFLEANPCMPCTSGGNQVHLAQVEGWTIAEHALVEVHAPAPDVVDARIAQFVADRIPDRATIQVGIGRIPHAILGLLRDRRDLGIHTELLSDAAIDLIESGAVTGRFKTHRPGKVVTTFCLGTRRLYDYIDNNPQVELWQADFARGANASRGGQGFIVLRSRTHRDRARIVARLTAGSVVTTGKNTVDHVVTEHGVAALRGRSLRDRATALIGIAHPADREALEREAHTLHLI